MHNQKYASAQHVTLECPSCEGLFESNACNLHIGERIVCPNCCSLYLCRSKELFDAIKHIKQKVF